MGDRIKCLGLISLPTSHILFTDYLNPQSESQLKSELINLVPTLSKLNLRPQDYQKIHTSTGTWFCFIDVNKTALLLLTSNAFPVASVVRLQRDLLIEIQKIDRYFDPENMNLKESCKVPVGHLLRNYDKNPEYNDNLVTVQQSVEKISDDMQGSMRKLLDNTSALQGIEGKTAKLGELAGKFKNEAGKLKDKIYRERNMQIIVAALVSLFLLVVIVYMVRTVGQ